MALQEFLWLSIFPLFQQLKVHIYDLQKKIEQTYQETTKPVSPCPVLPNNKPFVMAINKNISMKYQ